MTTSKPTPKAKKSQLLPPLDNGAQQIAKLGEAMIPQGEDGEMSNEQLELLSAMGLNASVGVAYSLGHYHGVYKPLMVRAETELFKWVLFALGALPDQQPEHTTHITMIDLITQDPEILAEGAAIILLDHTNDDHDANGTPHPFGTTKTEIADRILNTRGVTLSQMVNLVAGSIQVQGLMANLGKALLLGAGGFALTGQKMTPQASPTAPPTSP